MKFGESVFQIEGTDMQCNGSKLQIRSVTFRTANKKVRLATERMRESKAENLVKEPQIISLKSCSLRNCTWVKAYTCHERSNTHCYEKKKKTIISQTIHVTQNLICTKHVYVCACVCNVCVLKTILSSRTQLKPKIAYFEEKDIKRGICLICVYSMFYNGNTLPISVVLK